jgi:hypothetical protein
MSETIPPAPSGPAYDGSVGRRSGGERPVIGLLIAAAAVAAVTIGLVVRFGLIGPPELASVDASTRPQQSLAVLGYVESERSQCLVVVEPAGTSRTVRCDLDAGPLLGWDDRGILMLRFTRSGERIETIDPVSGDVVASDPSDPSESPFGRWDPRIDSDRGRGSLTVRDEDGSVIWQLDDAPEGYYIVGSDLHPATGMVVLLDSAGRLLVIPDGASEPRVWVEDLGVGFGELAWEGTPLTSD